MWTLDPSESENLGIVQEKLDNLLTGENITNRSTCNYGFKLLEVLLNKHKATNLLKLQRLEAPKPDVKRRCFLEQEFSPLKRRLKLKPICE